MKLELLDAYSIRARLSASIIVLAPGLITISLCFEEILSLATSSMLLLVLIAFTNYIPILQRCIHKDYMPTTNYAAQLLTLKDTTIDLVSKKRYYTKLMRIDGTLASFEHPEDSEAFYNCCVSAVAYLKNHTRNNHLVQEENITYGFCKNLFANKTVAIILCVAFGGITVVYSLLRFDSFSIIPIQNYFALAINVILLLFWTFGITEKIVERTAIQYAKTLIASIDTLSK